MAVTHAPAPPDRLARPDRFAAVMTDMARAFHAPGPGLPGWLAQDLTLAQVRTLFLIAHEAPLPMGRMAEILGVSVASASGIVDRLERHGLVCASTAPTIGESWSASPRTPAAASSTSAGRRRLEMARRALDVLAPDELAEFHRLICLIADRSDRGAPDER